MEKLRLLLSSPSSFHILGTLITEGLSEEPLAPLTRGNVWREFITSSYSSSNGRSEEVAVVAVEAGDKEGLCTISCRKEGSRGAGVSIFCSSGDEREE
jgi:hypothetical protein